MTFLSTVSDCWLGLCRKTPVIRASETGMGDQPEPSVEGSPNGGAGGSRTIQRGTGAVLSGTKTLIRNPELLWFSFLIGLVLTAHFIAQAGLFALPDIARWVFFLDYYSTYLLTSLVLTFAVGFLTVFCPAFLLAGLVRSLSSKKDGSVSFFQGLNKTKKYLIPLTGGSVVMALAWIQLFVHPFIVQGVLFVRNPQWMLFIDPYYARLLTSLVLTFAVEFLTVFCLVFLLAGLVLSLSSKKGGPVSFFQGLTMAKKHLIPLAGWSLAMALAGTLLFSVGQYSYLLSQTIWQFLESVLNQFPFNYTLKYIFPPVLPIANLPSGIWLGLDTALVSTLILSAINIILFVLTLFVVPLLVLEKKCLKEAVLGSFTLMRNIWGEVAACILGLGMVLFAASLMFLLFRFSGVDYVWWDTGAMYTSYSPPSDAWAAAGILYVIALSSLALVVATVGGIASLNLYRNAKIRESA